MELTGKITGFRLAAGAALLAAVALAAVSCGSSATSSEAACEPLQAVAIAEADSAASAGAPRVELDGYTVRRDPGAWWDVSDWFRSERERGDWTVEVELRVVEGAVPDDGLLVDLEIVDTETPGLDLDCASPQIMLPGGAQTAMVELPVTSDPVARGGRFEEPIEVRLTEGTGYIAATDTLEVYTNGHLNWGMLPGLDYAPRDIDIFYLEPLRGGEAAVKTALRGDLAVAGLRVRAEDVSIEYEWPAGGSWRIGYGLTIQADFDPLVVADALNDISRISHASVNLYHDVD